MILQRTIVATTLALLLVQAACAPPVPPPDGNDNQNMNGNGQPTPADTFPTSLHFTRQGKANFYSATFGGAGNAGFEAITGIPMSNLDCQQCHPGDGLLADGVTPVPDPYEPTCGDCHADASDPSAQPVNDDICLGCHSRQNVVANVFAIPDVHRDAGMACTDCHSQREMHGDGTAYSSLLEPGAMDTRCENCHEQLAANSAHAIHAETELLDCSACHVQTVVSCYSCHFESEVMGGGKRFFAPPRRDFVFLVNRDADGDGRSKVTTATFQSLTYHGQAFYTIAPFYAHSVSAEARQCDDCHGNAAVTEYTDTGRITVTRWDADSGALTGPAGVIPIPPDWRTALLFDFVTYAGDAASSETDPTLWEFLKTGADATQMLFAEPLSAAQLEKLSE